MPAMNTINESSLGRPVAYAGHYDASRLFAIPRAPARAALGLGDPLPFHGVDIWNAYELSWLDPRGKPVLALGEFRVPATSPALIESKSLKLYLNGFMQTRMDAADAVRECIARDLSHAAGASVVVQLMPVSAFDGQALGSLDGECIDDLELDFSDYARPEAALLRASDEPVEERLVSHLLKSNCPVTGQPDWASLQVDYAGDRRIDRGSLLRYLVGFREHADFHEQCVERIYRDLHALLRPLRLGVYARYTRRGGLDINPFRSSDPATQPGNPRLARQ
jgi:7-cyano-7-deazaguanine reductase